MGDNDIVPVAQAAPQIGMKTLLMAMGDAVYDWSLASGALHWLKSGPEAEARIWGQTADIAAFQRMIHPDDLAYRAELVNRYLTRQRDMHACEYRLLMPDGRIVWVEERGSAEYDEFSKPVRLLASLRQITARKETEERLLRQAHYDDLTGLYNFMHLRQALDHALAYARRYQTGGMYLTVGIDNMSLINNALGTGVADDVIIAITNRLKNLLQLTDIIGRAGGDHFGIIVNHSAPRDEAAFLDGILSAVNGTAITTSHGEVGVTVSIGVAKFIDDGLTAHDVMSRAEIALQAAKRSGRNCIIRYQPNLQPLLTNNFSLTVAEEVRAALRYGRICLAYQAVVHADDSTPAFYECLARIRREDGSLLPAGAFIPTAEQMGLMREIDEHIVRLAVYELRKDRKLRVAVNLSAYNVGSGAWSRHLRQLLTETPDVAERLIIEITETAALADPQQAAEFVRELQAMGCQVALDDFGAGYTSYRQLHMLPVDIVKIDSSFANGVSTNIGNQLFVRTLIELAKGFGLATIAEGVESAEDAEMLKQFGVTYLQGYYFAKPDLRETIRSVDATPAIVKVAG